MHDNGSEQAQNELSGTALHWAVVRAQWQGAYIRHLGLDHNKAWYVFAKDAEALLAMGATEPLAVADAAEKVIAAAGYEIRETSMPTYGWAWHKKPYGHSVAFATRDLAVDAACRDLLAGRELQTGTQIETSAAALSSPEAPANTNLPLGWLERRISQSREAVEDRASARPELYGAPASSVGVSERERALTCWRCKQPIYSYDTGRGVSWLHVAERDKEGLYDHSAAPDQTPKPCPHCGSDAFLHGDLQGEGGHAVSCKNRACSASISGTRFHPAIARWNSRASTPAPSAQAEDTAGTLVQMAEFRNRIDEQAESLLAQGNRIAELQAECDRLKAALGAMRQRTVEEAAALCETFAPISRDEIGSYRESGNHGDIMFAGEADCAYALADRIRALTATPAPQPDVDATLSSLSVEQRVAVKAGLVQGGA